jgi:outer membrane receptor for ferrienterochelin and colicin
MVVEIIDNNEVPIVGANIYLVDGSKGVVSDKNGNFLINDIKDAKEFVVSYVGYLNDTLKTKNKYSKVILKPDTSLEAITIKFKEKSSSVSLLSSANVLKISSEELLKAACCNLAESFETTPSIDLNFSDAISGRKQINMLGLASPNILISVENIPSIRGALNAYGLTFIPGTWIESIQIAKGSGSVVNGYESVSGQINAELLKPMSDNKFFANAYYNSMERFELNTHYSTKLTEKIDYGLYLHADKKDNRDDHNNDNFGDSPTGQQINILNRFQYTNAIKGLVGFFDINYVGDERVYGEIDYFDPAIIPGPHINDSWGGSADSNIIRSTLKFGYVDPEITYRSLGLQLSYSNIDQGADFGNSFHDTRHTSFYSNLVYNSIIGDTRSKIKTGISFANDNYDESVNNLNTSLFGLDRTEKSIGAYFEYNYDNLDNLNLSAGIRYDNHNIIGNFISPRLHVRFQALPKTTIKMSAGKANRIANLFSENQKLFYSSRLISFSSADASSEFMSYNYFDMKPEVAWNYGASIIQSFKLFGKDSQLIIDYYITDFESRVVVDWESPSNILFYNLVGRSYSKSFQAQFSYSLANSIDLLFAYKNTDAKTDYISGRLQNPLTPSNRFFLNLSYDGPSNEKSRKWKFDLTYNHLGKQRIPSTIQNPEPFRLNPFSSKLDLINSQITRVFSDSFEVYLGVENLTNYKQTDGIISNSDPFGQYFDATMIYGPVSGRMSYLGLRYKIN